jgi:hypothetical protein
MRQPSARSGMARRGCRSSSITTATTPSAAWTSRMPGKPSHAVGQAQWGGAGLAHGATPSIEAYGSRTSPGRSPALAGAARRAAGLGHRRGLSGKAHRPYAVSGLAERRLAHGRWRSGKRQQTGGRSPLERPQHALGAAARRCHACLTQHRLPRSLGGGGAPNRDDPAPASAATPPGTPPATPHCDTRRGGTASTANGTDHHARYNRAAMCADAPASRSGDSWRAVAAAGPSSLATQADRSRTFQAASTANERETLNRTHHAGAD